MHRVHLVERDALGSAPPVSSITPAISPALSAARDADAVADELDVAGALGAVEHRVADAMHGERLVVGGELDARALDRARSCATRGRSRTAA